MFVFCRIAQATYDFLGIFYSKGVVKMLMSWIYMVFLGLSLGAALLTGRGSQLAAAIPAGAKAGIDLALVMAGSLCLWTGVGKLMEKAGLTAMLSQLLRPLLYRIFPDTRRNQDLAASLSANICANFLGLGNAATPMGILSARRLCDPAQPGIATDQMCRLIVLNTASIQLIPTTVAAVRGSLGCATPFDILPAVWVSSLCSATLGLCAAWVFGKLWPHG